jgi:PAS domain S-box-containing protein
MTEIDAATAQLLADLRESEARFRAICEHAPVMIDQFAPDGRCLLWNRECEKQLGYTQEEIEQCDDPLALVYPDPAERTRVLDAIQRADGTFREYRVRARDGTDRVQMWADFRLPSGAKISVGHDVTAQRRVEDQLRQSQKMEALGQLTGGMAHDFNNLLTVVMAHAEMLQAMPPGSPSTAHALDQIIAAASRGAALVQKLLAVGRHDLVAVRALDLQEVVYGLVPTLKRLLPDSIRVRLATEPPLPQVLADRGAIEQALINLVTNARDAMPEGGSLTVELSTRWLGPDDAALHGAHVGEHVALVVSDEGTGMAEEVRDRVFEPFFTTKGHRGSGLGLPMVYGLMRQQRGVVYVHSEPGAGTSVHLLFRRAEAPTPSPPRNQDAARVLVVEDEGSIRRLTVSMLEKEGYAVEQAPDGRHALEQLRAASFDLVVCDVVMPGMGGVELLTQAHAEGVAPSFLFVTGYAEEQLQELRDHPRFVGLVAKPYRLADFREAVALAIQGSRSS